MEISHGKKADRIERDSSIGFACPECILLEFQQGWLTPHIPWEILRIWTRSYHSYLRWRPSPPSNPTATRSFLSAASLDRSLMSSYHLSIALNRRTVSGLSESAFSSSIAFIFSTIFRRRGISVSLDAITIETYQSKQASKQAIKVNRGFWGKKFLTTYGAFTSLRRVEPMSNRGINAEKNFRTATCNPIS